MRSTEDKGCLNNNNGSTTQEISGGSCMSFEFHKTNNINRTPSHHHHRTPLGKPTPSKWDDAQKWLVNLSRGEINKTQPKASPRNSNADDRKLIVPVPKKDDGYSSGDADMEERENVVDMETKNVDCDETIWRVNNSNPANNNSSRSVVRSICLRDMGTEMTPIASQEPSRTATPIRATTPASRSPISSPVRFQNGGIGIENGITVIMGERRGEVSRGGGVIRGFCRVGEEINGENAAENKSEDDQSKVSPLETRAVAWDEAERAKYMARYKREEVKIQAWENHEKRKAEMRMRKVEVKAERLKSRAQEKYTNKLASSRRIAEEKRANAEAKLNEKAVKTSQRADYIRRSGHLPSSLSFKLPSLCW